MKDCKAMIFAAGLGTRLYPLTADKPKALVEISGKPLLQYAIEKLIAAGFSDIVINVHHFANQIIDYVKTHCFEADIQISDESDLLMDTGGGLKFAEPLLKNAQNILLYNVDILSNIDLKKLLACHVNSQSLATLAVRDRKTSRYFVFDKKNGQLLGWRNKTSGDVKKSRNFENATDLAFSGIHIVKNELLSKIPADKPVSITSVYLELAKTEKIIAFEHSDDLWFDVGKLEMVEQLNLENPLI